MHLLVHGILTTVRLLEQGVVNNILLCVLSFAGLGFTHAHVVSHPCGRKHRLSQRNNFGLFIFMISSNLNVLKTSRPATGKSWHSWQQLSVFLWVLNSLITASPILHHWRLYILETGFHKIFLLTLLNKKWT